MNDEISDCPKMNYSCPYYDAYYGCLSSPVCRLDIDFELNRKPKPFGRQKSLLECL